MAVVAVALNQHGTITPHALNQHGTITPHTLKQQGTLTPHTLNQHGTITPHTLNPTFARKQAQMLFHYPLFHHAHVHFTLADPAMPISPTYVAVGYPFVTLCKPFIMPTII